MITLEGRQTRIQVTGSSRQRKLWSIEFQRTLRIPDDDTGLPAAARPGPVSTASSGRLCGSSAGGMESARRRDRAHASVGSNVD